MDNIWGEMLEEQVHNKCVSPGKSNSSMLVHLAGHIKTRNSSTGSKVDKGMKQRFKEKSKAEMHIAVVTAISILGRCETHLYFILSLTSHSQVLQCSVSLCMMECTHCSPLEIKLNEMSI